jgi:ABC-type transporter Mla subunit MlaD
VGVLIPFGLDPASLGKFNGDLAALQQQLGASLGGGFQAAGGEAVEVLKRIEENTQKVKAGVGGVGKAVKEQISFDKVTAGIEGVKRAIDTIGGPLLGFSQHTKQIADSFLTMASTGLQVGKAFGPEGALAGAVAGGLAGLFSGAAAQFEEGRKKIDAMRQSMDRLVAASHMIGGISLDTLIDQFGQLQRQMDADTNAASDLATKARDIEREIGEKFFSKVDALAASTAKGMGALKDHVGHVVKSSEELGAAISGNQGQVQFLTDYAARLEEQFRKTRNPDEWQALSKQIEGIANTIRDLLGEATKDQDELDRRREQGKQRQEQHIEQELALMREQWDAETELRARQRRADVSNHEATRKLDEQRTQSLAAQERERVRIMNAELEYQRYVLKVEAEAQAKAARDREAQLAQEKQQIEGLITGIQPALQGFGDAFSQVWDNVSAGNKALEGVGKAWERSTAQALKAQAREWAIKGAVYLIEGALYTALGDFQTGSVYLVAGAALEAEALLAGAVGAGLAKAAGPAPGSRGGSGGGGGGGGARPSLGRDSGSSGPTNLAPIKIYYGPENGTAVYANAASPRDMASLGRLNRKADNAARKAPR